VRLQDPITAVEGNILKYKYFQFLKPKSKISAQRRLINHMTLV
jgi:hypothetical protein